MTTTQYQSLMRLPLKKLAQMSDFWSLSQLWDEIEGTHNKKELLTRSLLRNFPNELKNPQTGRYRRVR